MSLVRPGELVKGVDGGLTSAERDDDVHGCARRNVHVLHFVDLAGRLGVVHGLFLGSSRELVELWGEDRRGDR